MKLPQFQVQNNAWEEPNRLNRMRYTITHLVTRDEICLAEIGGTIVVAKNSEGRYVIPVWPSSKDLEATFALNNPEVVARQYSRDEFENIILKRMQDDELIAVFPDQNLHYEQLDKEEIAQAIKFVENHIKQNK